MKSTRRAARASGFLASSLAIVSVCRFLRNVVLARMLLPEDFGIGATFTLSLTFFELLTELGPAKQLIQARHGARAAWMGVAHLVLAARGVLIAAILFLASGTIAGWFGVPDARSAFQFLALAPLMRGFEHCDVCRFQRHLRFSQLAWVEAAPAVLSLLLAPLAATVYPDYRAFLAVTLVWAFARLIVSHVVASRPYRLRYQPEVLRRFLSFGWPLLGNSLLLFLILHGERLLVATRFDLATLGAYSVALGLGFAPTMMFAKLHSSVALPVFSRSRVDRAAFRRAVAGSSQIVCLVAGLVAIAFVVAGSWLVGACYGKAYLVSQQVIPWIGLMCAMRVVRCTPSMMSIALGDTQIPLLSNIARVTFFGVGALFVSMGNDVAWVPASGFLGELMAYLVSLMLLRKRHHAPVGESLGCLLRVASVVAIVVGAKASGVVSSVPDPALAAIGGVALFGFAMLQWETLRTAIQSVLFQRKGLPST
ncbi:Teichuronic acid biosynthesis protein TuaB [Botrimarina colliarenosi]|uniref:Teichuronic acid biosynthesis protein TuaB n=1 Tax=Botrimarina colliarenosi TaxID=2528001 RepID=A0A5C6AEJ1_9BACT|nr:oligosaccharide flippase family protein [Botrimarina colliarenosi]TWT97595.1 Teichuronic acid biosynthesis protein TuaB [Botrimarina colliarenosi]